MLRAIVGALLLVLVDMAAMAQARRDPPYWASISASQAMMRTGPGRNYPATWEYRRADLPIKVIEVYQNWRKVEDPGGTTGWIHVNLLSATRTALVTGDEVREMHEKPDPASAVRFFAEPGVVGRLSDCSRSWCRLDVNGRRGFIRIEHIWGLDAGESF